MTIFRLSILLGWTSCLSCRWCMLAIERFTFWHYTYAWQRLKRAYSIAPTPSCPLTGPPLCSPWRSCFSGGLPLGRVGSCLRPCMVWRPIRPQRLIFQTLFQSLWKEKRADVSLQRFLHSLINARHSSLCFVFMFDVLVFVKHHKLV